MLDKNYKFRTLIYMIIGLMLFGYSDVTHVKANRLVRLKRNYKSNKQFNSQLQCYMNGQAVKYIRKYGCICRRINLEIAHFRTPVDELDGCCKERQECYKLNGCPFAYEYEERYENVKKCKGGLAINEAINCDENPVGSCQMIACLCDRGAVSCIAENYQNRNPAYMNMKGNKLYTSCHQNSIKLTPSTSVSTSSTMSIKLQQCDPPEPKNEEEICVDSNTQIEGFGPIHVLKHTYSTNKEVSGQFPVTLLPGEFLTIHAGSSNFNGGARFIVSCLKLTITGSARLTVSMEDVGSSQVQQPETFQTKDGANEINVSIPDKEVLHIFLDTTSEITVNGLDVAVCFEPQIPLHLYEWWDDYVKRNGTDSTSTTGQVTDEQGTSAATAEGSTVGATTAEATPDEGSTAGATTAEATPDEGSTAGATTAEATPDKGSTTPAEGVGTSPPTTSSTESTTPIMTPETATTSMPSPPPVEPKLTPPPPPENHICTDTYRQQQDPEFSNLSRGPIDLVDSNSNNREGAYLGSGTSVDLGNGDTMRMSVGYYQPPNHFKLYGLLFHIMGANKVTLTFRRFDGKSFIKQFDISDPTVFTEIEAKWQNPLKNLLYVDVTYESDNGVKVKDFLAVVCYDPVYDDMAVYEINFGKDNTTPPPPSPPPTGANTSPVQGSPTTSPATQQTSESTLQPTTTDGEVKKRICTSTAKQDEHFDHLIRGPIKVEDSNLNTLKHAYYGSGGTEVLEKGDHMIITVGLSYRPSPFMLKSSFMKVKGSSKLYVTTISLIDGKAVENQREIRIKNPRKFTKVLLSQKNKQPGEVLSMTVTFESAGTVQVRSINVAVCYDVSSAEYDLLYGKGTPPTTPGSGSNNSPTVFTWNFNWDTGGGILSGQSGTTAKTPTTSKETPPDNGENKVDDETTPSGWIWDIGEGTGESGPRLIPPW